MKKKKKNTNKSRPMKIFDIFLNISFFVFILIGGFLVYSYFTLPELETDNMIRPNDSYVYDKNDQLIGKISRKKENQENIKYKDLNQSVINSLVGTEDATFFTHKGVDLVSTTEKAFKSILKIGDDSAGGSSITQQIIGWSHLDRNNKSYTRKVDEILLSFKAEREVSKDDILEMYLNYFFYGKNNVHGIEKASEYFFDKHAYELDYIQSALMTGTLNSPTNYNPLGRYDSDSKEYVNKSKERLDNVLLSNYNKGYLSKEEYFLIQQTQVENSVKINDTTKTSQYSAYIDLVRREMEDKYNVDLTKSSMKIYTNMDKKAQNQADRITTNKIAGARLPDKDMNFGFMMTKTQTGAVVAVGGGKQYRKGGSMLLNNAIDIKNQPGSAFKPIIDYAPTYEFLHWPERAPISNAAYKYPGTNTSIRNFDGKSGGIKTIDQALADSRNLTAVRALEAVVNKIGFKGLNQYLTKLGFKFSDDELAYAYALGGTETGISPAQMNGAYQAFGNGGKYIEPWTIRYYINEETNKKVSNPTKPVQAIDEKTAFMMSSALERSTQNSTLMGAMGGLSVPFAGKTGTSNWGTEGAQYGIPNLAPKDSWFTGYTTNYTLSVWTGFDAKGIKRGKYPAWGNQHDYAAIIWGSMMRKMVTGKEKSYLKTKAPKGLEQIGIGLREAPFSYGGIPSWAYSDNLPSGAQYNTNVKESDFKTTVTYDGNGKINFQFKDVDAKVDVYVQVGNNYATKGGTYSIKNNQSFTAYYIYNGQQYGVVSGCIKNNKITTKKCPALY